MGPLDHLRTLLDGIACTVCEEHVSADRVRLLARRDDLLFLQVDCAACGSSSLGFLAEELVAPEADRCPGATTISSDDVLDMHALLESWTGDLASLVGGSGAFRIRGAEPGDRPAGRSA